MLAGIDVPEGLRGIYASSQSGICIQAVRRFGANWIRTMPDSFFETGEGEEAFTVPCGLPGTAYASPPLPGSFSATPDRPP